MINKKLNKKFVLVLTISLFLISVNYQSSTAQVIVGPTVAAPSAESSCTIPVGFIPIFDEEDFNNMRNDLSANYILCDDITFTSNFEPIGGPLTLNQFEGILDGNNKTLINFTIDNIGNDYTGIFTIMTDDSIVKNLYFESPQISGDYYVGTVAGISKGKISNVHVFSPTINVYRHGGAIVGFLTGNQFPGGVGDDKTQAEITNSSVSGNGIILGSPLISGGSNSQELGGIVGRTNNSIIKNSFVKNGIEVNGGVDTTGQSSGQLIGGLVGHLAATHLLNTYAEARVVNTGWDGGGLVGMALGDNTIIENSFSTGEVIGNTYVGGLVGLVNGYVEIFQSYSNSDVSGELHVGGLVGGTIDSLLLGTPVLHDCYSTGTTEGNTNVGGLIGIISQVYTTPILVNNSVAFGKTIGLTIGGQPPLNIGGAIGFVDSQSLTDEVLYNNTVNTKFDNTYEIGVSEDDLKDIHTYPSSKNWDISFSDSEDDTVWKIKKGGRKFPIFAWELY